MQDAASRRFAYTTQTLTYGTGQMGSGTTDHPARAAGLIRQRSGSSPLDVPALVPTAARPY
ncbi:MAG TPA: hypothetical protein VII33_04900 [Nakamurella sp.]